MRFNTCRSSVVCQNVILPEWAVGLDTRVAVPDPAAWARLVADPCVDIDMDHGPGLRCTSGVAAIELSCSGS
jgi:hypothetical protein